MASFRHLVLTGAPGAGKTTLLSAAKAAGNLTSPEVARRLLRQTGGMELRECDPLAFAEAMLEAHLGEYELYKSAVTTVWFDRGFPDVVGFLDVSGLPVADRIDQTCRNMRYFGPILRAPVWPEIYSQDGERTQNLDEAIESDRAVTAAWKRYGYEMVDLPLSRVEDRLAFANQQLS